MNEKKEKLIVTHRDLELLREYFEENNIPKDVIEEMIEISFLVVNKED